MHVTRTTPPGTLPRVPRLLLPVNTSRQGLPGALAQGAPLESETVIAGLAGTVVRVTGRGSVVIEGQAAIVSGTLGAGRQVAGPLAIWQPHGMREAQVYIPANAILVVPGPLNLTLLHQALYSRIAGIVASSIPMCDFENFLHINLVDLLHVANPELLLAHLPPLTVMLTEGLGTMAMPARTLDLLEKYQGRTALLAGLTSLTARVYPELLMSLSLEEMKADRLALKPETDLVLGTLVRVCSGLYEGALGEIDYLFAHRQHFPSGVYERAARVRLEDGSRVVVPLSILERIG